MAACGCNVGCGKERIMAKRRVTIGIIGAGGIAPVHINAFRKFSRRCEVTAICDITAEAAKQKAEQYHLKAYGDHVEMLEKEKPDAVIICTPPDTHATITLDVLASRCAVLCEKPLAMTAADGRRMVRAAGKAGTLFMVAFCHRFHEPIVRIKREIDRGRFGPVTTFRNVFCSSAGNAYGRGGNLMDNGSHSVDLMRYLLGDPWKVVGAQFRPKKARDLDKVIDVTMLLSGPNEAMAYLEAGSRHAGGRATVEVCGHRQSAIYDYAAGDRMRWFRHDVWEDVELGAFPSRFERQAEHFLNCLTKPEACITDIHSAQKTMELSERIRAKAEAAP